MDHHFSWFTYIPALAHVPGHISAAIFVASILVLTTLIARMLLAKNSANVLVPSSKFGFLNFFDIVAEQLYNLTKSLLGKDAGVFFPLTGCLFIYILASNLLGMIPGFLPPTDNINTTLAMGLFVFVYYNYQGIKAAGLSYLKHFLGPVWYMAWLLLPIEIVSHVVRPFSLGLRLSGNMQGDHMVVGVITDLMPSGLLLPVPFYFLGILVCFIQAFVFTLLTMVYISMAKETAHH